MELTREEIEHYLYQVENNTIKLGNTTCSCILRQLLAEMDKPKVWDNAPDNAVAAYIEWRAKDSVYLEVSKSYFRELPKSPVREIAEKWANTPTPEPTRKYLADTIEAAIKEALEKVK